MLCKMMIFGTLLLMKLKILLWRTQKASVTLILRNIDAWVIAGDFNQVLFAQDKLSSCPTLRGAEKFKQVIASSALTDVSLLVTIFLGNVAHLNLKPCG